jgi:hypothetical protein
MQSINEKSDLLKSIEESLEKMNSTKCSLIEFDEPITSRFHDQDKMILEKVNPKNKLKAEKIISDFDFKNAFKVLDIMKKFKDNYQEMRKTLENYSKLREQTLINLTSKL